MKPSLSKLSANLRLFMLVGLLLSLLSFSGSPFALAAAPNTGKICRNVPWMGTINATNKDLPIPTGVFCYPAEPGNTAQSNGSTTTPNSSATSTASSITILNNSGKGFTGLNEIQGGGYPPPDTQGGAGPDGYIETVNVTVALYTSKTNASAPLTSTIKDFLFLPILAWAMHSLPMTTRLGASSSVTSISILIPIISTPISLSPRPAAPARSRRRTGTFMPLTAPRRVMVATTLAILGLTMMHW